MVILLVSYFLHNTTYAKEIRYKNTQDCSIYLNQINKLNEIIEGIPDDVDKEYRTVSDSAKAYIVSDRTRKLSKDKNTLINEYNKCEQFICKDSKIELSKLYNASYNYIEPLFKNDTISYNLRELKKINNNYEKHLNVADKIEWCLATYTYHEWYYYAKWVEYEYSNKYKTAIDFYKKSIEYTKKNTWEDYLSDSIYKQVVKRVNNLSKNKNIVWFCGVKSYLNNDWNCVCEELNEWKDISNSKNLDCKMKSDIEKWIKTLQEQNEQNQTCWINEYYYIPTKDDLLYDLWPTCSCKDWYDKVPGATTCTLYSTYKPTNKDKTIIEKLEYKITIINNKKPKQLNKLKKQLEIVLPKIDKNSRKYYLLNEIYEIVLFMNMDLISSLK